MTSMMACAQACSGSTISRPIPLIAAIIAEIDAHYPDLDESRRGAELVRELISHLIGAVVLEAHAA